MKRKLLKIFATLFIGVICVLGISACGEKHTHTHNFTEKIMPPTCTERGYIMRICECGVKEVGYVDSLGHNFEDYIYDNNATCLKDGTETAVCSRCSNENDMVVDTRVKENTKLSHTYDQQIATQKYLKTAATCTNKAVYYYSCSCGAIGTETFEYGTTNHTYNQKVAEEKYLESLATCTSKAKYYYSCTCGEVGNETFEYGNMLEHTYDRKIAESKYLKDEATCTSKALYYTSCSCGAVGTETFEYGDKREHVYDKEIAESKYLRDEATCTSKAVYYYSCICGDTRKTTTFQYGTVAPHAWDKGVETKEATCTQTGAVLYMCESCFTEKTEIVQRKEHEITKKVIPATCSEPGYTLSYCKTCTTQSSWNNFTQSEGHSGSSYCYDCGKSYVSIIGDYVTTVGTKGENDKGTYYSINHQEDSMIYSFEYFLEKKELHCLVYHVGNNNYTVLDLTIDTTSGKYDWMLFLSTGSYMEGYVNASNFTPNTVSLPYTSVYPNTSSIASAANKTAVAALELAIIYMDVVLMTCPENITIKDFGFSNYSNAIEHEHEWEQVGSYTKSTCTSNGKVKYECALDGCSVTKTETISAHGHVYGSIVKTQEETCTQIGIWKGKCSFCGNINETTINKLGHETSTHYTIKEQSCTETGIERYTCSRCDYYEDKEIPMDSHEYEEIDGENGYVTEQCSVCKGIIATPITYIITYELGGGTKTDQQTYTVEDVVTLTAPERTGYIFIGWTGTDLTDKTMTVTIPQGTVGERNYTAHWTLDSINVLQFNNDEITGVTELGKTLSIIEIPQQINGVAITSIGDCAFYNCSSLTEIVIPDSVVSIGDFAFEGCNRLTSVEIPDSVTSIGDSAFYECESLTSVVIPDSVTSIGFRAFAYCSRLTSVVIGDSVTSIGAQAFKDCNGLTSVVIGDSVKSIGDDAFAFCGRLTSVVIPDSVTCIGNSAFMCCSLTSMVIPDSVKSIGWSAFLDCDSLTEIVILDGVTSIGSHAFCNCDSLTNIKVGENNTSYKDIDGNLYSKDGTTLIQYAIGKTATAFTIPDSVVSIGDFAFYNCDSLTSVEIPDSVISIGDDAFYGCYSLTEIIIPDSVTSIGKYAFYNCDGLKSITFKDTSTWYRTTSSSGWENKTGGTKMDVTTSSTNATYFTDTYHNYYWYKL